MLELIRFTSGSHAEEFMAGRLYMNSLGFFWNNGFEGQRDMFEGVAQMQDPRDSLFSEEYQNALCASIMIRAEAFQFCNLLCFHRHFYDPLRGCGTEIDPRIGEFGDCAVRITDPDAFINRVYAKAEQQGDICVSGPVAYHAWDEVVSEADCFDKLDFYSYQKEWRIAYLHKPERLKALAGKRRNNGVSTEYYEEPYVLHIGRLDDIAATVSAKEIIEHTHSVYGTCYSNMEMLSRRSLQSAFSGWRGRPEFRSKVLSLDGGALSPILIVG